MVGGCHFFDRVERRRRREAVLGGCVNPPREDEILALQARTVVPGEVRPYSVGRLHASIGEDTPVVRMKGWEGFDEKRAGARPVVYKGDLSVEQALRNAEGDPRLPQVPGGDTRGLNAHGDDQRTDGLGRSRPGPCCILASGRPGCRRARSECHSQAHSANDGTRAQGHSGSSPLRGAYPGARASRPP